ncbi:cytochrome P450 709B1-like [Aegilops tauschii subsp. strangulata]|uniref:Secologanin synthase n=3 Tax=Aegilops tauschii subsp. strangulata TaxID=200361 RepID=A0A453QZR9_AEGTS|nr:cytochrome P450 709B1-like [Aegilops tauschii subsp. strangulata]
MDTIINKSTISQELSCTDRSSHAMVAMAPAAGLVLASLAVVLATTLWKAAVHLVWRPYAVARAFQRQGIRGPAYRFFVGNNEEVMAMRAATADDVLDLGSHDIIARVMPQYKAWVASYGKIFLSWSGYTPSLCVGDHDMVKQILSNKTGLYAKPNPGPNFLALLGKGLVFSDGDDWARHRRIVHPAFTMDKLKMMTRTMAECAGDMVRPWEALAAASDGGVARVDDVGQQFVELTADVISHTAFGSSYREGKEVFMAQRELQYIAFSTMNNVRVPGLEYLPTKTNLRRRQLTGKVRGTLMAIIRERQAAAKEAKGYGNDLLGLMLEANASAGAGGQKAAAISMDEIIDECKTFFFAGHDTTSHLLTWAIFLLGTHPEWQQKLREEVLRECGGTGTPLHGDALNKLKLTTMVLYETLRLYGAVIMIARETTADTELGGVKIPKGTTTMIPMAIMHRDEEVWGADAGEFKPDRFQNGVGRAAKHPSAMLAFSAGPRSCIGQDFAMLEAKATLAVILRRFEFEVAPEYVHAPAEFLTLQPKCGLPVLLKLLGQ